MSAVKNDGTVQYGSRVLSIGTLVPGSPATISSGVSYVADSFSISRPTSPIERTNELGEPSGQVVIAGFVTGSATIQLATSSTLVPILGKHFIVTVYDADANGDNDPEVFFIDSLDQPQTSNGETKVNINFRKAYNTTS